MLSKVTDCFRANQQVAFPGAWLSGPACYCIAQLLSGRKERAWARAIKSRVNFSAHLGRKHVLRSTESFFFSSSSGLCMTYREWNSCCLCVCKEDPAGPVSVGPDPPLAPLGLDFVFSVSKVDPILGPYCVLPPLKQGSLWAELFFLVCLLQNVLKTNKELTPCCELHANTCCNLEVQLTHESLTLGSTFTRAEEKTLSSRWI